MSASSCKCPDCGRPLHAAVHPEDRTLVFLFCVSQPCNPMLLKNLGAEKLEPIKEPIPVKKKKRRRY